jgi:SAM-dependent MidA family methyltransferase
MNIRGVISFARFMELALYCPVYGYYEKEGDTVGRRGDFYTSVSAGALFGQLLAFQFAEWLEQITPPGAASAEHAVPLRIVEAGAHDGRLANDILQWLRERRSALFNQIEYWLIEPSESRVVRQKATLDAFAAKVRWAKDFASLPDPAALRPGAVPGRAVRGVIFCNELLDAMPVHRVGWDARRRVWFEWGVTYSGGEFVWARMAPEHSTLRREPPDSGIIAPANLPEALLDVLPDGFTTEFSPRAECWWSDAARALLSGRLLTFDYGLATDEFFTPARSGGTLRGYHRHHLAADVLSNAGEQDITAHVDFTRLQRAGEASGLATDLFTTQSRFLTQIGGRFLQSAEAGGWTGAQTRQFQTLTHPEHLGGAFRVLVQSRCA